MDWLTVTEGVAVGIVIAAVSFLTALFVRRRWLEIRGGVVDCGLRKKKETRGGAWSMGIARYDGENFEWYRVFSVSFRPKVVFSQQFTQIVRYREMVPLETMALFDDHTIITVVTQSASNGVEEYELSMTVPSLTGLMSWLESAPPGGASYRA